ncbi:MAG: hypothetical protein KF784_08340 [Fimbriimonadaceae bacterium]|nr:hypothetical protein [Fimbriimonadaceae bacterium]
MKIGYVLETRKWSRSSIGSIRLYSRKHRQAKPMSDIGETPTIQSADTIAQELPVENTKAPTRDEVITAQIADAIDRGFDVKKWIRDIVRFIGWRQAVYLLFGFGAAWALAYFGFLSVKQTPKTQAEEALGVYSIERIDSRDDKNASPPTEFIAEAKSSVLITGFSAFRTVENNPDTIQKLLDDKVDIYMLVLDPRSPDVAKEQELDPKAPVKKNQMTAIETVVTKYANNPSFHLRFMKAMPGITGIVVDAEIEPRSARPRSTGGKLRYQIKGFRIPQRKGYVIQLTQSSKEDNPMFNLFWEDFRTQWKWAQPADEVLPAIGLVRRQ